MFAIGFETWFGEIRGLDSESVFIQRYFTMHISGPHWFIGLDLEGLVPGKVGLQLFKEILIGIIDIIFQDDTNRDSALRKLLEVVFEGLMGDFVILEIEEGIRIGEEGFVRV